MDSISSTSTYFMAPLVNASFAPKEDITAYELAVILAKVHGQLLYEADWQALGTPITRHFKRLS